MRTGRETPELDIRTWRENKSKHENPKKCEPNESERLMNLLILAEH